MRVPGTINWLNAKKIAAGRISAMASLLHNDAQAKPLSKGQVMTIAASSPMPAASERQKINVQMHYELETPESLGLNRDVLSPFIIAILSKGNDRSANTASFARLALDRDFSNAQIIGTLLNPDNPISGHCLDQANPYRAAMRAIECAQRGIVETQADRATKATENAANGTGEDKVNKVIGLLRGSGITAQFDVRNNKFEICVPNNLAWNGRKHGCLALNDATLRQLCNFVGLQIKISIDTMDQVLRIIGDLKRFDPVKDYLETVNWDGKARLDDLLPNYCGAEYNELHRGYGRHWMLGAVARAYWPGCRHDEVLALIGQQGVGKSNFAKIMGGEWHSDIQILRLNEQQLIERLSEAWIHEIGEIRLSRRDEDQLKALLSSTHLTARAAYARTVENVPMRWAHVATGNNAEFLTDATGNRRWHVANVSNVNIAALKHDRDQLWAEAVMAFKILFPNWENTPTTERRIQFPKELWKAAA